jgi:hypothetical protein
MRARGDTHPCLFAGGAGPVGTGLLDPAGPVAQSSWPWPGLRRGPAANRYLTEPFLPQYHTRFLVRATEPGTAFIPWVGTPLAEILCVQEERVVATNNTVRYQGLSLQIPQAPRSIMCR